MLSVNEITTFYLRPTFGAQLLWDYLSPKPVPAYAGARAMEAAISQYYESGKDANAMTAHLDTYL